MTVTATQVLYMVVQLSEKDMAKLLEGKDVIIQSKEGNEKPLVVRVFCSHPHLVDKSIKEQR